MWSFELGWELMVAEHTWGRSHQSAIKQDGQSRVGGCQSCKRCGDGTIRQETLRQHRKKHTSGQVSLCFCNLCLSVSTSILWDQTSCKLLSMQSRYFNINISPVDGAVSLGHENNRLLLVRKHCSLGKLSILLENKNIQLGMNCQRHSYALSLKKHKRK